MCPYFDIPTWSCIAVLKFSLGHESYVDIYTWTWIMVLIFSLGSMILFSFVHASPCSYSHIFIYRHGNIHTWSYTTILIFTLVPIYPCYSNLVIYSSVDILILSCVPLLIFILGHVYPWWYMYFVMCPHVDIHICHLSLYW